MGAKNKRFQNSRPTFWEQIQNHPIVVLIVISVAVASTTFGVAQFLFNQEKAVLLIQHKTDLDTVKYGNKNEITSLIQKYDTDTKELRERIVSIERRIGDSKYYDVSKFFIYNLKDVVVSPKAQYFPEERFYAFFDDSKWKYEMKKGIEFARYVHGDDSHYINILSNSPVAGTSVLHIWKGLDEIVVENNSSYKHVFAFITVEHVKMEKAVEMTKKLILELLKQFQNYLRQKN
jgi:hypothetical protein